MEMNSSIRLLTEAFDAHGLKYQVYETEQYQEIHVLFGIRNGPLADVRFISLGRGNDTSVRIMNLVNKVPFEKRLKVLEVCNVLNHKYRFLKFNMDHDNDVHVEYDFPASTGNDCLGEMAFEIFVRTMQILNEGYVLLAKALYSADDIGTEVLPEISGSSDLLKMLKEGHDRINITISKAPSSGNAENNEHASS